MIDRPLFFERCAPLFGGSMSPSQVAGCEAILKEWGLRALTNLDMLADILATAKWETNATMQPVIEAYWLSDGWRRRNLRYYPFFGRGFVQLTWERNYRRMTELLRGRFIAKYPDFDLVKHPDQALIPEIAIAIMFEGMLRADSHFGDFTGLALEDFFTATKHDFIGARAIINGTDHAADIAEIAAGFVYALGGPRPIALLRYGSHGPEVAKLQQALATMGYYRYTCDADFGNLTRAAVMEFQRDRGLDADGVAGRDTQAALHLQ